MSGIRSGTKLIPLSVKASITLALGLDAMVGWKKALWSRWPKESTGSN
jgi:hypothetical protein